ncbi:MAG: copper chaperone CopZ [Peptostreptococcales bacterium]
MEKIILKVDGMSCSHCENAVKNAVGALDGVKSVTVNLAGKEVTVEYEPSKVDLDKIKNEILEQGYSVLN